LLKVHLCGPIYLCELTDLYKYFTDAVPPIHAVSYHVTTDKPSSKDGDMFRSIFSDNLQPIATRGKKSRGTLLVDQHCGNGCSIKRAPLSVSYYNEISGGHIWWGCTEEVFCRPSTAPVCEPLYFHGPLYLHGALLLLCGIFTPILVISLHTEPFHPREFPQSEGLRVVCLD